jgi:hypothetical protein
MSRGCSTPIIGKQLGFLLLLGVTWIILLGCEKSVIDLLSKGKRMDNMYFIQSMIDPLRELCYADGRQIHQRQFILHLDNASICVLEQTETCGFSRTDHPTYSPDLAPCDFFLFGHLKANLAGQLFDTDEELFLGVRIISAGISGALLVAIFAEWIRKLETCYDLGGEYVE